jgi:hypothetical protein
MIESESLFESIMGIAESIQALNQQAVQDYTTAVEGILCSRSRDTRLIEHTLDGLLDFCGHRPILSLYQTLCRHYYFIDPAAAADYVRMYREQWDLETEEKW